MTHYTGNGTARGVAGDEQGDTGRIDGRGQPFERAQEREDARAAEREAQPVPAITVADGDHHAGAIDAGYMARPPVRQAAAEYLPVDRIQTDHRIADLDPPGSRRLHGHQLQAQGERFGAFVPAPCAERVGQNLVRYAVQAPLPTVWR